MLRSAMAPAAVPGTARNTQLRLSSRADWYLVAGRLPPRAFRTPDVAETTFDELFGHAIEALRLRGGTTLVLPAGTLQADDVPSLVRAAQRLGERCTRAGLDLLVAGDVSHGEEWAPIRPSRECLLFGLSQGSWRIGGAPPIEAPHRVRARHLRERVLFLGGRRALALMGSELFSKGLREAVAATEVEVLIVLSHHAPTRRWEDTLSLLREVAPTLVVSAMQKPRTLDGETTSWEQERIVQQPELALDALCLRTSGDPS